MSHERAAAAAGRPQPRRRSGRSRRCRRAIPTPGGERSRSTCSAPTTSCARRSPGRWRRDGGLLIHLTTGARGANAKPYWSAYSASKAGAEHLVRSAAADVEGTACGICSLDPGITETPMQEELRSLDFPDRERFVQRLRGAREPHAGGGGGRDLRAVAARAARAQRPDVAGGCAVMDTTASGPSAYELMQRLFPLCRSLTGDGVRATFDVLEEHIPLTRTEVASRHARCSTGRSRTSGTSATPTSPRPTGRASSTSGESSLHVVGYSEPVRARMPLERAARAAAHAARPARPDPVPDLLLPPHLGLLPLPSAAAGARAPASTRW